MVRFWDSDVVVFLVVSELGGTAEPWSLCLLDRAEVVDEPTIVPKGTESFVEAVASDSTPWVVLMSEWA